MQQVSERSVQEYCANMLKSLHTRGISAIPLQGKRPHFSVKWKQFQQQLPPQHQIDEWVQYGISSYGIICGRISQGIIVIDFDSPVLYEGFCRDLHYICDTYTVKTKRGFHVYLKTKFAVAPRSFKDCDIKGDGGYVVGAESVIDGHRYYAHRQSAIRSITYQQYQQLLDWLCPKIEQPQLPINTPTSDFDLVTDFERGVQTTGRNNALFATACKARQHSLSSDRVMNILIPHFVTTPPTSQHKSETPRQRLQEARRTIKSAYTRKHISISKGKQLPNSIRERLLQIQNSTIVARLLDAIRLTSGSSDWITSSQLLEIAKKCHISKRSLYRVLCGDLSKINGKRIFKRFDYEDHKHHIYTNASQGDRGKPKSARGRPIQFVYRIPSNYYLCNILKVDDGLGDKLQVRDLASADTYRRALHRELIRRLSPMVRVAWLAKRLGVHRRTIFRYNVQLNVNAMPMIERHKLTHDLARGLPVGHTSKEKSFTPGMWLQSASGKRYPAILEIANKFANEPKVWLCRQLPSKYTLDEERYDDAYAVQLPNHLRSRATLLTYENVASVLAPDWATKKFDLGGYLAVYNGYEWTFRPPLRVVAYPLVKRYEEGLIYYIRPLKS